MYEVIADLKEITDPIDAYLKPLGFKKHAKRRWYRETPEIEQLFYLDCFRFEPKNRLYLYGNIRRITPGPIVKARHWDIGGRMDEFGPEGQAFMHALDQEYVFDPPERRAEIITAGLKDRYALLLAGMDTEAHAVQLFKKLKGVDFYISGPIRESLAGWFDPLPGTDPET